MKILGYSAGTYSVEYIPEQPDCKPLKLSIQLDTNALNDKDQVLDKLKQASPQEFWYNQIVAAESDISNQVASNLVNTRHAVRDIPPATISPVTSYSFHPTTPIPRAPATVTPPPTPQQGPSTIGSSTPEEVASHENQNIIKLKILIQQVIQEMADGTV
jgi:hypothetical protein